MKVQSIFGLEVSEIGGVYYWDTAEGSGWRFTSHGLSRFGAMPGSSRKTWIDGNTSLTSLREAVALTLGWSKAISGIVTSKISEVAPALVAEASNIAGELSRKFNAARSMEASLPTPEDYGRAADVMCRYRDNLDVIVQALLNGAVSCSVALGNAREEAERLLSLAVCDDKPPEGDGPKAA